MDFWHSMVWKTDGIQVVAPVKWRCLDGLVGVFWEAESQPGAQGYYLAEDPRIMIFSEDVSSRVRISNDSGDFVRNHRPMTRAIYIPAGVPMWTTSRSRHRFSHLNLHMHRDRVMRFLSPSIGSSAALTALKRPVEIQDIGPIETLAGLVVDEISAPSRHSAFAESLVGSIVTGMLDIPSGEGKTTSGRLTQAQMNKLTARIDARSDCRLTIQEMAETVGLSESWFASVFKQTTGKSPLQWQLAKRIELAKTLLMQGNLPVADIAVQLGFSDQAHLTKAFRQATGNTPVAWRRVQQLL
ncbi:AraC family transcriptional regulator [Rhizobium deserti]|uniref:AraC family transcriptional regulator n=1 Tax=Rhizobium deserti TaxID=2547961 RepID=A0A4V3ANM1_9HYPH|nr:AraC family transcriptional regulator [Rhizobium deserti]TDK31755.1 AraC family transcriptional regulator [Rhizobium deserti]